MHKQLISFAQVINFLENMNLKGGLTQNPPLRTPLLQPVTILPQICAACCTKLMELFYCYTVAIGLPGNASDYSEDKNRQLQHGMQNKVVVE